MKAPAETSAPAADAAAAATGTDAAPAHVESGTATEAAEVEDDEPPFNAEQANACMTDLVLLDIRLRAEGHTLADVLATAAKNAYGVDVR